MSAFSSCPLLLTPEELTRPDLPGLLGVRTSRTGLDESPLQAFYNEIYNPNFYNEIFNPNCIFTVSIISFCNIYNFLGDFIHCRCVQTVRHALIFILFTVHFRQVETVYYNLLSEGKMVVMLPMMFS